ncbi:hypothetical protein OIDMADRAFT_131744, partial [Oidiodendron maius Zn]
AGFIVATSGIGESTLKKFAQYTNSPRAYFIGRSQDAANRVMAECKALNLSGEYIFMKADVSLIHAVDNVCKEIRAKEKVLNLLFLNAGVMIMDRIRIKTSEHVHLLASLNYYARIRFFSNLLPLLQNSPSLRRIVTVGGGGMEGPLGATDFPALRVPLPKLRGHLCTLITLGLESVSKMAPEISFVHDSPGSVSVPIEECGKRHLYLATSARYPPGEGESTAVRLGDNVEVATGSNGEVGSGVYSVGSNCESASSEVRELLAGLREKGMVEDVWRHTELEFKRISKY